MKVIVCGAGRVGQGIARHLAGDGHAVTVIDAEARLVESLSAELEVQGVTGHAAHPDILRTAGAADADMIVAATYSDEVNMVTCQIAHALFQTPTKIARVRSQAYQRKELYGQYGLAVDVIISPERAVADSIFQRLETPGTFFSAPFGDGRMRFVGVGITGNTPLAGTIISQIGELFPGLHIRVLGIVRNGHFFIPGDADQFLADDRVYLLMETSQTERLVELLGLEDKSDHRIVIIGAGNIGYFVAKRLEKRRGRKIRLVEHELHQAEVSASQLDRSIVIHGDGLNPAILEEAGIGQADAVIGLTNDDNVNLLAASLGKRLGARKAIALVNRQELSLIHSTLDIDVIVDPRVVTISQVLKRLRKGRILQISTIEDGRAEIVEGEVLEHSPLLDSNLMEGSLPEGIVPGAVMRGEELLFPSRDLRIQAGDRVVLLYEREKVKKVEMLFRASSAYFIS